MTSKVTNLAPFPGPRRRGLGTRLLLTLLEENVEHENADLVVDPARGGGFKVVMRAARVIQGVSTYFICRSKRTGIMSFIGSEIGSP